MLNYNYSNKNIDLKNKSLKMEVRLVKYICSRCNKTEDITTHKPACECGGLWKLDYRNNKFSNTMIVKEHWNMMRYKNFIPVNSKTWAEISLGEGMTPMVRLNKNLLLKMDYLMPTLSFKDRGAAVLIAHCRDIGVKSVVQDSSGNAGNSIAAYCARAGIDCEIFVPEGASEKKIEMIKSHNAEVTVVPGSRDHCADVCRKKVQTEGKYYANHVYNPFFYEGTKTYIYEVYEELKYIPQNIYVPLGNGTLFIGIMKGLEDLLAAGLIEKMPQIIAVQSENCAPIAEAVKNREKTPADINISSTLAEGIAIGRPMRGPEILDYIYKYSIDVITAPENRISKAKAELAAEGIYIEDTTAATYAAYLKYSQSRESNVESLLPMCGAGLKK